MYKAIPIKMGGFFITMLRRLFFLFYYFLAWMVLFQAARLLFVLYHLSKAKNIPVSENAGSFWYGLRMDVSAASYILLPVCLLVVASVFFPLFRKGIIYKIFSAVLLLFFLLITGADLQVYKQWGFRIDATPLKYLSSPKEAWASVSHLPIGLYVLIFVAVYSLLFFLFDKFLKRVNYLLIPHSNRWWSLLGVVVFIPVLIIMLRGGLQQTPLNQSNVYFSTHAFANHAAINASWNFLHGALNKTAETENPYIFLSKAEAQVYVDSMYNGKGATKFLLKNTNPNIILIIWESFTAKVLDYTIEGKEVTPNFNRLKKEGIYFSNMWASGDRTDKGLTAILSGYPALPATSVIQSPGKASGLPVLTKIFNNKGYSTPFYYGGEAAFANIKSYLVHAGIHPIIEKKNFSAKDQNSKWGAHDGVVAARFAQDFSTLKQPFFATWLTLSSHEPFETPVASPFTGEDDITKFLASVHYTDGVLANFIEKCKLQPWWSNTLVVIIADHGHVYPQSDKLHNFAIPMLWLGGAVKDSAVVINKICSQLDFAATILAQTATAVNPFIFSKNILDTASKPWAFFSFNNGFGLVQPYRSFVFDNAGNQKISEAGKVSNTDVSKGKALQQVFYQDFVDR